MPFGTKLIDREGIMLNEINQIEKYRYHKNSLIYGIWKTKNENKKQANKQTWAHGYREQIGGCLRLGVGMGEMGEGGQKVQTFSCKISKSGDVMYNMKTTVKNTVLHIWKLLKRMDLESPYHKKKNYNYVSWWMLTRLMLWSFHEIYIYIYIYIKILNHYIVHTHTQNNEGMICFFLTIIS